MADNTQQGKTSQNVKKAKTRGDPVVDLVSYNDDRKAFKAQKSSNR